MARYIYDEVKKEVIGEGICPGGIASIILRNMIDISRNIYKVDAPGLVPEKYFDEYKKKIIEAVTTEISLWVNFGSIGISIFKKMRERKKLKIAYDYASK